jgi:hypothetical protein
MTGQGRWDFRSNQKTDFFFFQDGSRTASTKPCRNPSASSAGPCTPSLSPFCTRPMLATMPWLPSLVVACSRGVRCTLLFSWAARSSAVATTAPGAPHHLDIGWMPPLDEWRCGCVLGATVPSPSLRWLPDQSTQLCLPFHPSMAQPQRARVQPHREQPRFFCSRARRLRADRRPRAAPRDAVRAWRRGLGIPGISLRPTGGSAGAGFGHCASIGERAGRAQLAGRRARSRAQGAVRSESRPPDSRPTEDFSVPASPEQGAGPSSAGAGRDLGEI